MARTTRPISSARTLVRDGGERRVSMWNSLRSTGFSAPRLPWYGGPVGATHFPENPPRRVAPTGQARACRRSAWEQVHGPARPPPIGLLAQGRPSRVWRGMLMAGRQVAELL